MVTIILLLALPKGGTPPTELSKRVNGNTTLLRARLGPEAPSGGDALEELPADHSKPAAQHEKRTLSKQFCGHEMLVLELDNTGGKIQTEEQRSGLPGDICT